MMFAVARLLIASIPMLADTAPAVAPLPHQ